jgi:FkbM family methyltransferase
VLRTMVRALARRLPKIAYPVLRGPLRGTRFVLGAAAGEGGGASIYLNMVEPAGTQAFLSVVRRGQIVFDIGANIGYYALLASKHVGPSGRVLAFEPSPRNISYLHRHLELNRVRNVMVVPMACADRTSIAVFAAGSNCATGRLADLTTPRAAGQAEYVATVSVDQIVRESGLVPNVMKIDVEGAEREVLSGAVETLRTARPVVLLSVHSDELHTQCTAQLRSLGYGEAIVCHEPGGEAELLFAPTAGGHEAGAPSM